VNRPPGASPFEVPPTLRSLDTGTIRLGYVEAHYERLVAEALEMGSISGTERQRLNLAAEALGLDPERAARLEAALRAASHPSPSRDTMVDEEELLSGSVVGGPRPSLLSIADSGGLPAATDVVTAPAPPRIPEEELHARYAIREDDGDLDAQWCAAAVLVHRGEATMEQRAFFATHRLGTPPRPKRALTPETWSFVFDPAQDRLTNDIFALIARPALIARVTAMRVDKTLAILSPAQLQDLRTSTVSAVRAIGWASATLGMIAPPIYVDPSLDVALEFVPAVPPVTRLGGRFLSGQSSLTLAYHCARHMTWYRLEHYVCTLLPSIDHLKDLFVAALTLGAPELDLKAEVRARVSLIAEALAPMLDPPQLGALRGLAREFLDKGGRTKLADWARAVSATASRAGLLLCGDLETACGIVSQETNGAERARELEAFWASDDASKARRALGVEIGG
jgi:golgin subfamily B member 1